MNQNFYTARSYGILSTLIFGGYPFLVSGGIVAASDIPILSLQRHDRIYVLRICSTYLVAIHILAPK